MLDTMTLTKGVAALCGALLIFLLGSWAGEELYHVGYDSHGYDDHHEQAYKIDTGEEDAGGEEVEETEDVAAILAAGDPAKGEKVFGKCKSCHKLEDGANGTGPYLYAVVDRAIGSVEDYNYSSAMASFGGDWTPENLYGFLEKPKSYMPGTSMAFAGLAKPTDRADLIAFLETVDD